MTGVPTCALPICVACALDDIATELEASVGGGATITETLQTLLPRLFNEHMPVVFNGNGYAAEWQVEAERRGLPNLSNTVDALERYSYPEVMNVFLRTNVLTEREMLARQEILLETYVKLVSIEAGVCSAMVRESILPTGLRAQGEAAQLVLSTRSVLGINAGQHGTLPEETRFHALREVCLNLDKALHELEQTRAHAHGSDTLAHARHMRDAVLPAMLTCRRYADALELMVEDAAWALPRYAGVPWVN